MTREEEDLLVEQVASAYRPAAGSDGLQYHKAWHDLDEVARVRAFDLARGLRAAESALDADGLSTTARAVLARISENM